MLKSEHKANDELGNNIKRIELFSITDVHRLLGMSSTTQWRERSKGRLNYRRIGRRIYYLRENLEEYLNKSKHESFHQN